MTTSGAVPVLLVIDVGMDAEISPKKAPPESALRMYSVCWSWIDAKGISVLLASADLDLVDSSNPHDCLVAPRQSPGTRRRLPLVENEPANLGPLGRQDVTDA